MASDDAGVADLIAAAAADIYQGRVWTPQDATIRGAPPARPEGPYHTFPKLRRIVRPNVYELEAGGTHRQGVIGPDLTELAATGQVVDCQAVYRMVRDYPAGEGYNPYDLTLAPPFECGIFGHVQDNGQPMVAVFGAWDTRDPDFELPDPWETAEPVDWDAVRWYELALIFARARHNGLERTIGPLVSFTIPVYEDGQAADIHWENHAPGSYDPDGDSAAGTVLHAINFLNCRNIELREPARTRAARRRLARYGIERVTTIMVRPTGRSTRGRGRPDWRPLDAGGPLTPVRGHFATYGSEGRGLLFGRIAGRFYIPPHVRGSAEYGRSDHIYKLEDH